MTDFDEGLHPSLFIRALSGLDRVVKFQKRRFNILATSAFGFSCCFQTLRRLDQPGEDIEVWVTPHQFRRFSHCQNFLK